jgi:hypothetical protein
MDAVALTIRLSHPRCPFCHETVEPSDVPAPCLACRAWHHAACLGEARHRCAACGVHAANASTTVLMRERARASGDVSARERAWSAALWAGALAATFVINESVIPAFATMFREVGVCLPLATELVLGAGGWVWGLGILSLLHAASLVQSRQTRGHLRVAAFLVGVLGVAFACWALFLPLIELNQKL